MFKHKRYICILYKGDLCPVFSMRLTILIWVGLRRYVNDAVQLLMYHHL